MQKTTYLCILIAVTIACYANSLRNQFVWDDVNNITRNERLGGPLAGKDIFLEPVPADPFYRPIPHLSIRLDYLLWGGDPLGYHLTNLFFHMLCVVLIFLIVQRLTLSGSASFITAVLFSVHPVHTEAVTYISGRSDPMCVFFLLFAFYLYISYSTMVKYAGRRRYLIASLLLFLLALLSKEIALIFPLIMAVYEFLFLHAPLKARFKRNAPFVFLAAAFLLFRHFLVRLKPYEIGLGKVYLLPKIFFYYLRLLLLPFKLHMQHNISDGGVILNMPVIFSAVLFAGLMFFIFRYLRRSKAGLFGFFWFFIGLMPFLGFLKFNSDMAEHWLYLASIGFFIMIASLLRAWVKRPAGKIILTAVLLLFAVLTIQRNYIWRDDISIYQDTLKYNDRDYKLHYNLGNAYLRKGLLAKARMEYYTSLDMHPDYAFALNNLGLTFEKEGDFAKAYRFYRKATMADPGLDVARDNISRYDSSYGLAFADEIGFDHSLYKEVLSRFTEDGRVDYVSLKDDPASLFGYIEKMAVLSPERLDSMPRDEKMAFYINAYNALTMKAIVDYYPVNSIRNIPGVWDRIKFKLAGRELVLSDIEHNILRKGFREPRVHFALNCASIGCPKLSAEPFTGKGLDAQLNREAGNFINDKSKVRLDEDKNILYLSSIFKWFKEDFKDPVEFVNRYLPEDEAEFIRRNNPRVRYLRYDWSLNER